MKKLIYPAWIMAFLVILQFSCQTVDPIDHDIKFYDKADISDIIGYWTATKVEYKIGAASMDVSEYFKDFKITIGEERGYCCINKCNHLFTSQKWQKNEGKYFNIFLNPETQVEISVRILERNGKIMTASIRNLTSDINKLFPDEDSSGHYLISFATW
jgi:hypothetical protein